MARSWARGMDPALLHESVDAEWFVGPCIVDASLETWPARDRMTPSGWSGLTECLPLILHHRVRRSGTSTL